MLNPHGHWKEGRLADTKDGSVAARCISFARQGMVAFSYDMVGYNDTVFPIRASRSPGPASIIMCHRQFATNRTDELWNISLMGLQTWNSIRALDFLESLPDVDKKRLACTGASGGGTQTFMLGAVDDRLAAQAPDRDGEAHDAGRLQLRKRARPARRILQHGNRRRRRAPSADSRRRHR